MNEDNKKELPAKESSIKEKITEKPRAVKQLTAEMVADLKNPLPSAAVAAHPTKPYLSTIKAIYVVERLNDVFGIGKWQQRNEVINDEGKMKTVHSFIDIPDYGIYLDNFGGNDNADEGDAFKGAVTDALTKMASYLGIGMDVYKGLTNGSAKPSQSATSGKASPKQKELIVKLMKQKGFTLASLEEDGVNKNTPPSEIIKFLLEAKGKVLPTEQEDVIPESSGTPFDDVGDDIKY